MPQCDVFSAGKLTVRFSVGTQIDFSTQKFPLNSLENGQMGTLLILSLAVYYGGWGHTFGSLGRTAGTQINFQSQKFPVNSLENGQTGTLVILSLAVYYRGSSLTPHCNIFFGLQNHSRIDGGHPD
jgi:hypothetical protein